MFVTDIRSEFYNILDRRVLILAAFDVDSLCACKIIQYLFHCDNILYTLIPVSGKKDLQEAFKVHGKQAKYVLLINCGATFDVIEFFQPNENVIFFIADSHRPIDVYNVYRDDQVRLLMKDESGNIPLYDELFREEDESDNDSDQPHRLDEAALERRRNKRIWLENRNKLLFDYTQFSYFGQSTALLMYDLAWKLSKENNDILWFAILGLTDQYIHGKTEQEKYVLEAGNLQGHVSRLNHANAEDVSVTCMKVSFDTDLQLCLYRHWSIFESIRHSRHMACHFKLWTLKGQKKLHGFLADIGLPLVQCKQKYLSMDLEFRANVKEWMENVAEKYNLRQIVYGSFHAAFGFRKKFCASDVVYAVEALLESTDKNLSAADKFLNALDSLSRDNTHLLLQGIEQAKLRLSAIYKQVQSFLDTQLVISAGPFLYAVVQEGPYSKYFSYPGCLSLLATILLHAHVSASKSRKAKNLPLVLVAPNAHNKETCLVIGVPPISEDSPRNFFGKAFETAGEKSHSEISYDYLDTSVVEIKIEDRSKFFDALILLMS